MYEDRDIDESIPDDENPLFLETKVDRDRLETALRQIVAAATALIKDIESETGRPDQWRVTYESGGDAQFDPLIEVKLFKALADAVTAAEVELKRSR